MNSSENHLILIAGPTCSGKSSLAREIGIKFNGQIINADSMQTYSDLNILTSRPSNIDLLSVPHKLYGYLDGGNRGNLASWHKEAALEIVNTSREKALPIVVGGTGLYLNSLIHGISTVPEISSEIKQYVKDFEIKNGLASIYNDLKKIDSVGLERINPNDKQRILRSYEVFLSTGKTLSFWQSKEKDRPLSNYKIYNILFMPNREELYKSCDIRFDDMIKFGAIEEVVALNQKKLDISLPIMNAIGVRELTDYLEQNIHLEEAINKAKQSTRNYAKRQITWFKNQFNSSTVIFEQFSESLRLKIFPKIHQFLLT